MFSWFLHFRNLRRGVTFVAQNLFEAATLRTSYVNTVTIGQGIGGDRNRDKNGAFAILAIKLYAFSPPQIDY